MPRNKRSFLERLTGVVENEDDFEEVEDYNRNSFEDDLEVDADVEPHRIHAHKEERGESWMDEEEEDKEGELMVDVYQTDSEIIIQTMVAGVAPEDMEITIAQDMVTLRGRREEPRGISEGDYFHHELYWGAFSRTITLPQEIESDEAEAIEKNGLLTIRLPKIDKEQTKQIHVKSV